jgi:SAM-dependent methyltransferase
MERSQFELHALIEDDHWWFVARRRIVTRLLADAVPPSPNRTVLEIGLGAGGNLRALAANYRCVGYDLSEDAVRIARERLPGVPVHHGDVLTDGAACIREADAILLLDVIEHIEHDRDFLRRTIELAKPGAWVLITVPADPMLWSPHDANLGHYRRYVPSTLASLWRDAPVEQRLLATMNRRLYLPIRWARQWASLRGHTVGEAGTDLHLPPKPINAMLERLFAGEADYLRDALRTGHGDTAHRGVSLMAMLRRTADDGSVT